jgi:hypothetical protein
MSPKMRDEVETMARELQRAKTSKDERITANTVMRVAVRLVHRRIGGALPPDGVRRMSLFGSAVRGELGPASGIDFLVEYDPSNRPGMVEMQEIEDRLAALYGGRKIDLANPKYLNPRLKERILAEAQLQYGEG